MRVNAIKLKDIAKALGVSISTVSRALKDHPDVKPETIQAAKELAEFLHYKPDTNALSLRNRKSKIIGYITPEISSFFFPSVLKGIEEITDKKGYSVMILQSNESCEKEVDCTETLLANNVDGLIISVTKETKLFHHFILAKSGGVPIVFIDKVPNDYEADKISVDGEDGTFKAVEYLINKGYKRIAIGLGNPNISISKNRLSGYLRALNKYKITVNQEYIYYSNNTDEAELLTNILLELPSPPDAIFSISDQVVAGVMIAINKKDLKIPEQVAVASFSDEPFCYMFNPPLTTVTPLGYELGKECAQLLIERIESNKTNYVPVVKKLKTELIIRKST
jgi:DNA-binding LacI/PurR family transcriptional regulator